MTQTPQPGAALAALRTVWDMSPEQTEYAYRCRHLNTYVYAAMLTLQTSQWPREGRFRLQRGRYPAEVEAVVDEILSLGPAIQRGVQPRQTRLRLTQLLNELYLALPRLATGEVPAYTHLLATLAFLSLQADRADDQPLWFHPPVRELTPELRRRLADCLKPLDFDRLAEGPHAAELRDRRTDLDHPPSLVNAATIYFVQPLLLAAENGMAPHKVRQAFESLERAMRYYERRHGLHPRPEAPLDLARAKLLRHHNTLYLYGGNHLERLQQHERARDWYLREIDTPELPELLGFYLTAMKSIERLLRAYVLTPGPEAPPLRRLIDRSLAATFWRTREYSQLVVEARASHPHADWGHPRVQLPDRMLFFGGEATREPLLISLIHQRVVMGVRYADVDYSLLERAD